MARLNVEGKRVSFLTLTFSGSPSVPEATRAFKAFLMRFRRKFPTASAIWRKEPQQRGAWHFHLLTFGMGYWSQKQLQYAWECCTNEDRSIVHIKLIRGGKRQAMAYVAKYMAKRGSALSSTSLDNAAYPHVEGNAEDDTGRFWGYVNRSGLPYDVRRLVVVDDDAIIKSLWDEMRRLSNGLAAQQVRAARFYGTCCYDLAEKIAHNAQCVIYDQTRINASKRLHIYNP